MELVDQQTRVEDRDTKPAAEELGDRNTEIESGHPARRGCQAEAIE
jgi:hypothetical protein